MDRLNALTAFAAIADTGAFAAAARRLGVSPQAVTRAIAGLESHLGVSLFHRSTRAVRLTEAGELYLERTRRALAELAQGEQLLRGREAEPFGLLTVTAPVVFGHKHVAPIVAGLLRDYPKLRVRLLLVDRFVNLVEEGVDVAVRIGELSDSALRARRIGEVRQVLVASPGYLAQHGVPATVYELRVHDIVAFEGLSRTSEWRFGQDGKQVITPTPRLHVNSADAAIAAVEAGFGIVRVYSYQVADAVAAGRLHLLLEGSEPPAVPAQLVFSAARADSANVRRFIDAMTHGKSGIRF